MVIKITHKEIGGETIVSVLNVMYAEALKGNILRLWSPDGDHCDCTELQYQESDWVVSTPVKAVDVVEALYNEGKYDIEASVVWGCN